MKYVRVSYNEQAHWAVLEGETVRFLEKAPYEALFYTGEEAPLASCRLLAPADPGTIICVGKNYRDHAMELGGFVPETPILFMKGRNTVNHPEGEIHAPAFVQRLDHECELAFVVKKLAKNVKPEAYQDYILGYTCLNDVTARDIQQKDGQWTRAKTMDGFCPMGPVLTDEIDPECVNVSTRLNGEVKQQGNTRDFLHPIGELLAFITEGITLYPGDVVTTGTPASIGPMVPGDTVEVEVEGIGVLRNRVV